jgi:hypothetical protein
VDELTAIEAWLPVLEDMKMLRAGVAVVERVQIAPFYARS